MVVYLLKYGSAVNYDSGSGLDDSLRSSGNISSTLISLIYNKKLLKLFNVNISILFISYLGYFGPE